MKNEIKIKNIFILIYFFIHNSIHIFFLLLIEEREIIYVSRHSLRIVLLQREVSGRIIFIH
jgi:hypothetical protein